MATALPPVEADALLEALDALGIAWWTQDAAGRYLQLSLAGQTLLSLDEHQVVGRTNAEFMSPAAAHSLQAMQAAAARSGDVQVGELVVEVKGLRRTLACAIRPIGAAGPQDAAFVGVWQDVSALRSRDAELQSVLAQLEVQQDQHRQLRAEMDGRAQPMAPVRLVRREQFEDKLSREIDLSLREHREFAVVYIGIDPAPATDSVDPTARERVISAFDAILRNNTRAMDAPSRLDGERFALLLSGVGLATAHARMEGLRRQCATQLIAHSGAVLRFTVSMGVASYPHTSQTQVGLLRAAHIALEQAQQRGGNHVALASIAFGSPPAA